MRNASLDIDAIFRPAAKTPRRALRTKDYPPLTQQELLDQMIELHNTGSGRAFTLIQHGVRISGPELERLAHREEARYRTQRKREQAYLRDVLPRVVALWAGKRAEIDEAIRDRWSKHAARLTFVPTIGASDLRPPWRNDLPLLRYTFRPVARAPMPPIAYMLVRLLVQPHWREAAQRQPWEPKGPSDLCCCKQCGKLFLARRPAPDRDGEGKGRTARDYCSTTCRAEAEKKQAAVRMERKRARDRDAKQKTQPPTRRRR